MAIYKEDFIKYTLSVLKEGEKKHILVTHDEYIFYTNDSSKGV